MCALYSCLLSRKSFSNSLMHHLDCELILTGGLHISCDSAERQLEKVCSFRNHVWEVARTRHYTHTYNINDNVEYQGIKSTETKLLFLQKRIWSIHFLHGRWTKWKLTRSYCVSNEYSINTRITTGDRKTLEDLNFQWEIKATIHVHPIHNTPPMICELIGDHK